MGWDRHKLLWDGADKYVPWTTLVAGALFKCSFLFNVDSAYEL